MLQKLHRYENQCKEVFLSFGFILNNPYTLLLIVSSTKMLREVHRTGPQGD